MPARFNALYQAFVLTCLMGSPRYVKTWTGCLPICRLMTFMAMSLSGTAIACLAFA